MARAGALSLGVTAALLAISAALLTAWFTILTAGFTHNRLGFVYDMSETADALLAPAVLLAIALAVLGAFALESDYMPALAVINVGAAAAGFANLALIDSPLPWGALKLLVFAMPPSLFLIAAACALAELTLAGSRAPVRSVLRSKT